MYRALATGPIGVKVPFREAVTLASTNGFDGISVSASDVEAMGVTEMRALLDEHALVPSSAGMPVNFRVDDATFERDLAALSAYAESMSRLGCHRFATWLLPWHETLTYDENFRQLRDRTARICDVLARYGVRYGLEFVGPETMRRHKPHEFLHDIDGLLALIEAVDAENLGFLLDAFHWYVSGGTAKDLDKLSDALVVLVHVNDAASDVPRREQMDNVRAMPGATGVIDIDTFMNALVGMDYSGPVIVEPFAKWIRELSPEEAVAETARSLDRIWPKGA